MRIVRDDRLPRDRVLPADRPVVAAGIGVEVLREVADILALLEQAGERRHDLRLRQRAATTSTASPTDACLLADEAEIQTFGYYQLTPRIWHTLSCGFLDAEASNESSEREFSAVGQPADAQQRRLRLPR